MNSEQEKFIELCKNFEATVKAKYPHLKDSDSPYYFIINKAQYNKFQGTLHTVRVLRNLCQHNNVTINSAPAITFQPLLFTELKKIISEIENPPTAKDVLTTDIISATNSSKVNNLIQIMKAHKLSNIPILEDDKVTGVFSENSIFSRLSDEEIIAIEPEETIEDYTNYIGLDSHDSERYAFVSEHTEVEAIRDLFQENDQSEKRLSLVFVTKHGKSNQPILGVITPWDIL